MKRDGFTLVELMVVVVVIGILAAIALPRFRQVGREAKETEARPNLRAILTLEERYRAEAGSYTYDIAQLEGGAALATAGEYFTYSVAAHASGVCVAATPTALSASIGISPQSLDANRTFFESANCS